MITTDMISIVIPLYNQREAVGACLESILAQSFPDYEVVVVNDGSTDGPEKVLGFYQKKFANIGKRYILIDQENKGANAARNRGAREALGGYIIFCDADIVMRRDMLGKMHSALEEQPGASYAYASHYFGWKLFRLFPFDADRLRSMPYIHTTSLIRREHFPGFDESVKRLQDWDLWLSMLEHGLTGTWINEPLFNVRSGGTMSSWLPASAYRLLPFLPSVKKYKHAAGLIKKKHGLK